MQTNGPVKLKWKTEEYSKNFAMQSRFYQASHAKDCFEIEELRRICLEETERARQVRTNELYVQKKDEPSTVNQFLSQIQDLQDKVHALNEEKEFYDLETASSSGMSHVPSQPSRIPSPRGMLSRHSGLPHHTRNSMGTSGNVFEILPPQERISPSLPGTAMRQGEGVRREPQSSTIPTPQDLPGIMVSPASYWRNLFSKLYDGSSEVCISELHFGKVPDPDDFQCWRVNFKTEVCVKHTVPSTHNVVDQ